MIEEENVLAIEGGNGFVICRMATADCVSDDPNKRVSLHT